MQPKTILVVDNDPVVRNLMYHKLNLAGYEVLTASTGREGLEIAFQHSDNLDLLVLDTKLPKMSGEEMMGLLHGNPLTRRIPILLCTDSTHPVIVGGLAAGAVDFILKPFKTSELLTRVQVSLEYYHLHQTSYLSRQL